MGIRLFKHFGLYLFRLLELFSLLFVVVTAFALIVDMNDRQRQRITLAWQLVTQNAPGNSGKGPALEYLNSGDCPAEQVWRTNLRQTKSKWRLVKDCGFFAFLVTPKRQIPLHGIDLSTDTHSSAVYLHGVELPGAHFHDANLSGTDFAYSNLTGAIWTGADLTGTIFGGANLTDGFFGWVDLTGAILTGADLTGATFEGANLTGAELDRADLTGATFEGANLSGAVFTGATFEGANLNEPINLSQKTLDGACGDEKTLLPEGLTIEDCLDE